MVTDAQFKELVDKVKGLKTELTEVEENTGGILSGGDIRDRVLIDEDAKQYLSYFEKRAWFELENWWKEEPSNEINGWKKSIVIKPYDELNITPFSYDLSLGNQVFSIQKPKQGVKPLDIEESYLLEPGETVVVITEELVAIPHAYSATVWPRFNMVKKGVFQSMVKIDPTWHGKLAVAMSNVSPATVELIRGEAFATLLFYELSKESDVDLWKLSDLQEKTGIEVEEKIPDEFKDAIERIDNYIFDQGLRGVCWVSDQSLLARGIKRDDVETLKECFVDERWYHCVAQLANKWTSKKNPETGNRMIVMNALGMTNLWKIVAGLSEKGYMQEEDVASTDLNDGSLVGVAVRYGKPFDLIAKIPETIRRKIEKETIPRIEAEIESKIQIHVTLLVLSLFGFISLSIAIVVATWKLLGQKSFSDVFEMTTLSNVVGIIGALVGLGFLVVTWLLLMNKSKGSVGAVSQGRKRLKQIWKLKKEKREAESKYKNLKKSTDSLRKEVRNLIKKQKKKHTAK